MSLLHRTRIKICGVTREEDLASAVEAGADALGFVFHPSSKRYVTPARAGKLCASLPPFVSSVALFVNPQPSFVHEVLDLMSPSILQFHGDESAEFCSSFGHPYLKAFRVGAPGLETSTELSAYCKSFSTAHGWLFDSYSPLYGGSGHGFDHSLLTPLRHQVGARPMVLSGGLNTANVGSAVVSTEPWAVDVSSGVEISPGIKSTEKMKDFVAAVLQARAN